MLSHPCLDIIRVETFGVVDGGVVLDDSGDLATVLVEEVRGPVSDGTESLHDKSLALNTLGETNLFVEGLHVEHLADGVVDAKTSGLSSSFDATLLDELASATAFGVNILLALNLHVGILDPGHDLLVGSHVGSETIDGGTDEALLNELHGVFTGDSLEFGLGEVSWVDLYTTLGTTEGNISDGELEGHKASESLDFLEINMIGVTGTSLDGELVSGVLGSKQKV